MWPRRDKVGAEAMWDSGGGILEVLPAHGFGCKGRAMAPVGRIGGGPENEGCPLQEERLDADGAGWKGAVGGNVQILEPVG